MPENTTETVMGFQWVEREAYDKLKEQRDELLVACEEALEDLEIEYNDRRTHRWPGWAMDAGECLKAAVAKAKEGDKCD